MVPEELQKLNLKMDFQNKKLRHSQINKNKEFAATRLALKEILKSPSGRNQSTPNSNSNPHKEVRASLRVTE